MNNLSWFIYFIDILPSFGSVLWGWSVTLMFVAFAIIGAKIVCFFAYIEHSSPSESDKKDFDMVSQKTSKALKITITVMIICGAIGLIIPKRQTLVLIAASEFGEKVVANQKVKDILDPSVELLQEWIKRELHNLKNKESK